MTVFWLKSVRPKECFSNQHDIHHTTEVYRSRFDKGMEKNMYLFPMQWTEYPIENNYDKASYRKNTCYTQNGP